MEPLRTVSRDTAQKRSTDAVDPVADAPVPPLDIGPDAAQKVLERASTQNSPVTGASILPGVTGGARPPSLEALMAMRPGVDPKLDLAPAPAEELYAAVVAFGAAGALAARRSRR